VIALQLLATFLSLCAPSIARAATVLAILGADAPPYHEAEAAIQKTLAARGDTLTSILLAKAAAPGATLPSADAVIAIGTDAATWAHQHVPEPVYFCMVAGAADAGLDQAPVCRGVSTDVPLSTQFSILAQTLPTARTVGMLYRSDTSEGRRSKERVERSLPAGWQLQTVAVNEFESKAKAIDELFSRKLDAVWTTADPATYDVPTIRSMLLAAVRHSVPVFGFSQAAVRAGGLVGVNIEAARQGTQVAELLLADRDAKQKDPATKLTPLILTPEHQVVVNLIVASKLGVEVPAPVIRQAAIVFREEDIKGGGQ
jgi:ABC-type uncharacterized transport system substrate-binding protein